MSEEKVFHLSILEQNLMIFECGAAALCGCKKEMLSYIGPTQVNGIKGKKIKVKARFLYPFSQTAIFPFPILHSPLTPRRGVTIEPI